MTKLPWFAARNGPFLSCLSVFPGLQASMFDFPTTEWLGCKSFALDELWSASRSGGLYVSHLLPLRITSRVVQGFSAGTESRNMCSCLERLAAATDKGAVFETIFPQKSGLPKRNQKTWENWHKKQTNKKQNAEKNNMQKTCDNTKMPTSLHPKNQKHMKMPQKNKCKKENKSKNSANTSKANCKTNICFVQSFVLAQEFFNEQVLFLYRFWALVFARFGLQVPRRQAWPPLCHLAPAFSQHHRFLDAKRRAFRAAASPSSRT